LFRHLINSLTTEKKDAIIILENIIMGRHSYEKENHYHQPSLAVVAAPLVIWLPRH